MALVIILQDWPLIKLEWKTKSYPSNPFWLIQGQVNKGAGDTGSGDIGASDIDPTDIDSCDIFTSKNSYRYNSSSDIA